MCLVNCTFLYGVTLIRAWGYFDKSKSPRGVTLIISIVNGFYVFLEVFLITLFFHLRERTTMPRKYVRKVGSRKYRDYSEENLENALKKVVDDGWHINRAAKEYGIAYGTIYNKYKGLHIKKIGGQPIFSPEEERQLIKSAVACSDWGFPLNILDLQLVTKNYLQQQGRNVAKFRHNMPGRDWVESLLKRHKDIVTQRLAANIKRARAMVSKTDIENYFANLEKTIREVPDTNLFNYDETNMADDPGRKRLLYKRGVKYPTNVVNFSKSATSVMFCGSASGVLLPPYVIYKAEHIWDRWTLHGPQGAPCCIDRCCSKGSRFNRTQSGWIDANVFTDWFVSTFLPHASNLEGKKVLIGDNLASHFTDEVINLCRENNIDFVCLPSNTTHISQPLDVCFFRPLKISWRSILSEWKQNNPSATSIRKEEFPKLLNLSLVRMDKKSADDQGSIKKDLVSGFKATGIFPLNAQKVLDKFPTEPTNDNVPPEVEISDSLLNYLKQKRFENLPKRGPIMKKKKIDVVPGKSVSRPSPERSSSSEIENVAICQDESDEDYSENAETEEVDYSNFVYGDIKCGDFLLVKVKSGRRKTVVYRYVVVVQEILPNNLSVGGLKSCDTAKQNFKIIENDVFQISAEEIIALLPKPKIQQSGDRFRYIFEKTVDVYEQ